MRRLLSFLFIAWVALLATNSAVLVREKEPVSLETISRQEASYLDFHRVQIEGVGTLTVRQPISDREREQIIRRATQFTCTYFTGRKFVTKKYPQRPSPGNVPAASCPNNSISKIRYMSFLPKKTHGHPKTPQKAAGTFNSQVKNI